MVISKQSKHEAKQLFRLCSRDGLLDEKRIRQVVQCARASDHRHGQAVLAHFLRLVKLDLTQHTATVESAGPLNADMQGAIGNDLKRLYQRELMTKFVQRPVLIGGMRIQVGSDVYDDSVLARLASLKKSF